MIAELKNAGWLLLAGALFVLILLLVSQVAEFPLL